MVRLIYVIVMRLGSIAYYVPLMRKYARDPDHFGEAECHRLAKEMIAKVARTARITTQIFGEEHLPSKGGYVLCANHQGKWDALGVMEGHPRPCRVLIDMKRSRMPLANEFVDLVQGERLDRSNCRAQVESLRRVAHELSEGKVYLFFPEGGYQKHQGNRMGKFYFGCFRAVREAKCPVVPVALIDFYKPFGENSLKRVEAEVHFLKPIFYDEYKDLNNAQLAELVRSRIEEKMLEVMGDEREPEIA